MSIAGHEACERVLTAWMQLPGAISCTLDIDTEDVAIYIAPPTGDDGSFADFQIPFRELVFSAAATAEDSFGMSPSDVSTLLRKLAEEIDGLRA
jgi:hypothetical protein